MRSWFFVALVLLCLQGAQCPGMGGSCCALSAVFGSWSVQLSQRTGAVSDGIDPCPADGAEETAFLEIVGADAQGQFTFDFVELEPSSAEEAESGALHLSNCLGEEYSAAYLVIEEGWVDSHSDCDWGTGRGRISIFGLVNETFDVLESADVTAHVFSDDGQGCTMAWDDLEIVRSSE